MRTDIMLNSTARNLLVCIAFLFYLSGCAEGGSGSDGGEVRSDGDINDSNNGGNNGSNVFEGRAIDIGDEWLYRKGTSAPPSDWISVGFDDSTWLAGNTGIGYGDGDDETLLSDMQGNYATVYTRKVVNYDGSFNITGLSLEIDYDDGFVAYINGQEVARANMPAGQPSFDTLASASHESGTAVLFNLDGFISLIGNGDNVLAIEIHNSSLSSSDLSFLPRLLVNTAGTTPPPTVSLSANPTNVVTNGSTTLNWSSTNATDCTASGDWSGNNMPTSGSQPISVLIADSNFTLTCSGAGGTANDSVSVTVTDPSVPIVNLSASPSVVSQNGSTTLSWTSSNVDSCTASGDWSGSNMPTSGSQPISALIADSNFTLTCSGAGGTANDSVSVTVASASTGTATVSWTPPTTNADGSTLTDLAGFKIHYGTSLGNYPDTITITNPGLSSHMIESLAPNTYYFVVTAFDYSNNESTYSDIVSKTIN